MRALYCLDPDVAPHHVEEVVRRCGLDAVVVGDRAQENEELLSWLRDGDLGVALNFPLFFDPVLLAQMPDSYAVTSAGRRAVDRWLHMACPRSDEFWDARRRALAGALEVLQPDLVCLDFARTFVMWERVPADASAADIEHGCWCARCVDGLPTPVDREQLGRNAVEAVTARVRDAVDVVRATSTDTTVGVKVVPWLADDYAGARRWACGQDLEALASCVDVLMPMSYSAMIGRPAHHVRKLHDEIRRSTGRPVVPWVQAASADDDAALDVDELRRMLDAAAPETSDGVCVFHLDGVADRPEVTELLHAMLSNPMRRSARA